MDGAQQLQNEVWCRRRIASVCFFGALRINSLLILMGCIRVYHSVSTSAKKMRQLATMQFFPLTLGEQTVEFTFILKEFSLFEVNDIHISSFGS